LFVRLMNLRHAWQIAGLLLMHKGPFSSFCTF